MAANENALTQPKVELGITGIIQNVFKCDQTTERSGSSYEDVGGNEDIGCSLGQLNRIKKEVTIFSYNYNTVVTDLYQNNNIFQ